MAKKLNSMPDYRARMPRHPHDLSQSTTLTAAPAMLLPCYYHMLHGGDKVQLRGSISAFLNPIVKPSLGTIDIHVDYFFVPLTVMYTPASSIFYQTDDLLSSLFHSSDLHNESFPRFNIDNSCAMIKGLYSSLNANMRFAGIEYPNDSFDCFGRSAARLMDLFDYNFASLFEEVSFTRTHNPTSTPWFLAAYHAIYELYGGYRNSDREKKSYVYNFDKYFEDNSPFSDPDFLCIHYVDAYKDYFNSIKVSPIGSSVSMLSNLNDTAQSNPWNILNKVDSYLFDGSFYRSTDGNGYAVNDADAVSIGSDNEVTASSIRQLFMVDKLLRVLGRADKNYESQFLAHFGIKIPHDVMHNITHIGHDMFEMNPEPTVSMADTFNGTTGSSLGEIGGKAYTRGAGKTRTFEAPFHGVLMAIIYYQPRFRYYAGVNKLHDLSSPDKFWQPEFDEKGMQPVFSYEVSRGSQDFSLYNERLGWQFAYEQFKRKYDRVTVAFRYTNSEGIVGTNSYAPWVLNKTPFMKTKLGGYAEPISEESDPQIFHSDDPNPISFKSLATDLNGIVEVPYLPTWINDLEYGNAESLFYRDPMIIDFHMMCKISNFMSEYGEPAIGGI